MEDELCKLAIDASEEKKALDLLVIDISEVSLMCDYMLICTGRSNKHVQGISKSILEEMKNTDQKVFNINGLDSGEWVLLDLGNVIVHVMQDEVRKFYTLEKLWNNGKVVYSNENKELSEAT